MCKGTLKVYHLPTPCMDQLSTLPRWMLVVRPSGGDHQRKAENAVHEFAQSLGCQIAERVFFLFDITEPRPFHLSGSSAEAFGTHVVHMNEAEGVGKGYPVSPIVHKFNLRSHFPKHRPQIHLRQRSLRNRTVGQNSRTSG